MNFCDLFEKYFGKSAVTMNIHLLRHYAFVVRNCGPLWAFSLFGCESNMGVLSRYYLGGGDLLEQIASKYIIAISNGQYDRFSSDKKLKFSINKNLTDEYDSMVHEYGLHLYNGKATEITFGKYSFKSFFSRDTKSIDYFFLMNDQSLGMAVYYIIKDVKVFVLLNLYKEVKTNFHLKEVISTEEYKIFPFDCIEKKMLYLQFGNIQVITEPPNYYEKT